MVGDYTAVKIGGERSFRQSIAQPTINGLYTVPVPRSSPHCLQFWNMEESPVNFITERRKVVHWHIEDQNSKKSESSLIPRFSP